MRTTFTSWLRGAAASLGALTALVGAPAAAKIEGATGPKFTLVAKAGHISTADGGTVYNWGFALRTAEGETMQYPGPTLIVEQGQQVEVTLINELPTNVSLVFPGQDDVTAVQFSAANRPTGCIGGVNSERSTIWPSATAVGKVTREARPRGCVLYRFIASQPGTYMYHSGTQMDVQIEMGLFGALIVRPAGAPKQAYSHAGTRFDREHLFVLSEIDPVWHQAVEAQVATVGLPPTNGGFRWSVNTQALARYNPQYWFINGRTAPDTMAAAYAPQWPHQPYNALPRMHPGERLLMRMINAGRDLHPFHHHGNNTWTLAVDGRMLSSSPANGPDLARSDNTLRMLPGQTVDAIYEWTGRGLGWDIYGIRCDNTLPASNPDSCDAVYAQLDPRMRHQDPSDRGRPLPTALPSALELTFGDMYSGSPFLGASGALPVGAGKLGSGGAYFHMFHSHNEREIINFGLFPGGMMTMVVIEPWNVDID